MKTSPAPTILVFHLCNMDKHNIWLTYTSNNLHRENGQRFRINSPLTILYCTYFRISLLLEIYSASSDEEKQRDSISMYDPTLETVECVNRPSMTSSDILKTGLLIDYRLLECVRACAQGDFPSVFAIVPLFLCLPLLLCLSLCAPECFSMSVCVSFCLHLRIEIQPIFPLMYFLCAKYLCQCVCVMWREWREEGDGVAG